MTRGSRALVLATATALVVGSVTVASAPTAAADPSPTVAGHVYDDVTGAPVEGVEVALVPVDDSNWEEEVWIDSGTDGSYLLSAPRSGSYTLRANDFRGRYVVSRSSAFDLAPAEQLTGKDFRLTPGVTITGLAVDSVTGDPLVNICPSAYIGSRSQGLHTECSGFDGRWAARGLVAGPTTVALGGDAEHASLWIGGGASQADATVFTTVAGTTVDAGTVRLRAGGLLTGRVTDQAGQPVADALITMLYDGCEPMCDTEAQSDADGRYQIPNVRPGRSAVVIKAPGQPYAWQWSGGVTDPVDAQRLVFDYEKTTQLDVVLRAEARLRVTATGASDGEYVSASGYTLSGDRVGWGVSVDESGSTAVGGLPAGRIKLKLFISDGEGNSREVWYGGTSLETARPIVVSTGRDTAVTVDVSN